MMVPFSFEAMTDVLHGRLGSLVSLFPFVILKYLLYVCIYNAVCEQPLKYCGDLGYSESHVFQFDVIRYRPERTKFGFFLGGFPLLTIVHGTGTDSRNSAG